MISSLGPLLLAMREVPPLVQSGWPPNAILLGVLLITPRREWGWYLAAALIITPLIVLGVRDGPSLLGRPRVRRALEGAA